MKTILFLLLTVLSLSAFAQQMTLAEWNREAETNIRLLPKYGLVQKTPEQLEADEAFLADMASKGLSRKKASEEFITLGFKYLYKDIKIAMYRFNQAYILDSMNVDIYWGYGGVYMVLGDIKRAREQYQIGLQKDDKNYKIITDLATCYMIEYYELSPIDPAMAELKLNKAIELFTQSYSIDKNYQSNLYKLSVCYYIKKDCDHALKYYNESMKLEGEQMTEEYKAALKEACGKK
ncbi:MAG: hypothetical protein K0R51_2462 [Cytophagaceae bacterium]|jgi:tetratricopeptide (TPR) repeat protein|nr:hypothetical protein [Cytophagaceae bacterium]